MLKSEYYTLLKLLIIFVLIQGCTPMDKITYLNNNQISQVILPDSSTYSSVGDLQLEDNILQSISFPQTFRLQNLNLRDNPLNSLDVSTLYDLRDLYILGVCFNLKEKLFRLKI